MFLHVLGVWAPFLLWFWGVGVIASLEHWQVYDPESLGLSGVGSWNKVAMTGRSFPKGNFYNESIDLTCNST